MNRGATTRRFTVADCITVSRMLVAPLLPLVAAGGATDLFTGLFAVGLASDALDGPVARKLNLAGPRGARLDSKADLTFYSAALLGLAVLVPSRLTSEWGLFTTGVLAYVAPMVAALYKFGRITSYHTILDRISLAMLAPAVFIWLWFDTILPLRIAVAVLVISAVEELVMTWKLQRPLDNVAHLFRLLTLSPRRREECVQKVHDS